MQIYIVNDAFKLPSTLISEQVQHTHTHFKYNDDVIGMFGRRRKCKKRFAFNVNTAAGWYRSKLILFDKCCTLQSLYY